MCIKNSLQYKARLFGSNRFRFLTYLCLPSYYHINSKLNLWTELPVMRSQYVQNSEALESFTSEIKIPFESQSHSQFQLSNHISLKQNIYFSIFLLCF